MYVCKVIVLLKGAFVRGIFIERAECTTGHIIVNEPTGLTWYECGYLHDVDGAEDADDASLAKIDFEENPQSVHSWAITCLSHTDLLQWAAEEQTNSKELMNLLQAI